MKACRARGMGSVLFESLPEPGVGASSVSSYSGTIWSVAALSLWWCAVYVSATYIGTPPFVSSSTTGTADSIYPCTLTSSSLQT